MNSTLFFILCLALQIIALFVEDAKTKICLLLGAAIAATILCVISTPLWIIIALLCGFNAGTNFKNI